MISSKFKMADVLVKRSINVIYKHSNVLKFCLIMFYLFRIKRIDSKREMVNTPSDAP